MKKIIISSKQLKKINEENFPVAIEATANTIPAFVQSVADNHDEITRASMHGDPTLTIQNPNKNGTNDDYPKQSVVVNKGQTIQQAIQQQANPNALQGGLRISGPGIEESKLFTKKQIEEARLAKMKAEGRVMTKSQLRESLLNNDNAQNTMHFNNDLEYREYIINNVIGGRGKVILKNVIDRGHRNGPERFELTDNGIIDVYNNITNRHVTVLFARIGQLVSRFGEKFERLPIEVQNRVKEYCREWKRRGYNEL